MLGNIDDGSSLGLGLSGFGSNFFIDERPNLITVDDWSPGPIILLVECPDTTLSEESRVTVKKQRG